MDNILLLHSDLLEKRYFHGPYFAFRISDPKVRQIHKASVRDRLVHHAITRMLYPYFDRKFVYDSYSCRLNKGTHRSVNRFRYFAKKVSTNYSKTVWVLKCDIKKFFANIDHKILKNILKKYIADDGVLWLLGQIIDSFNTKNMIGVGLPLGNLTSQLLINVYMNEFDQFVKRKLKVKYYIRYADDFIILSRDNQSLSRLLVPISIFLKEKLNLELHPDKVSIKTLSSGVDFLGWVHFPFYRALRTSTKRRMLKRLKQNSTRETISSYLGLLKHGNTYNLMESIQPTKKLAHGEFS